MIRENEGKRFSLTVRAVVIASISALVIVSLCGSAVVAQTSKLVAGEGKREIVNKVKQYPDSFISFENYEGVPLFIQEARVKEIGNAEYYQLTGFTTDSPAYTTFPDVTLTNNTDQRIIGLALAVGNKQTKRINGVKLNKISIEPHGSYTVKASDFIRQERVVRITADGKVNNRSKPDLDSEKLWLRARASDLILIVGAVDFENGNKWMMDRSKDPF